MDKKLAAIDEERSRSYNPYTEHNNPDNSNNGNNHYNQRKRERQSSKYNRKKDEDRAEKSPAVWVRSKLLNS